MERMVRRTIDYMEEHLLEDVSIKDLARHVYVSPFHLQRIFKALTKIGLSEYLRNRRLSLAGMDVLHSEETLLDIALKYQYDSLEGFSRAFYRFHGVNPSKARKESLSLKTYHPLKIHIRFEGGSSMDYKIVTREAFSLLCVKKAFSNQIIQEEDNKEIPDFWTEKLGDGTVEQLKKYATGKGIYGPCNAIDMESDSFFYGIGVPYGGQAVDGFDFWEIKHPLYAVFVCKEMDDMGPTWESIMNDFLPNSAYEMVDETDFEFYPEDEDIFCEIWVPVRKQETN